MPAFSASPRFFQSLSEGRIQTMVLGTVRQEPWTLNQAIVSFLRSELFLLVSTYRQFYYLNVPSQEQ